MLIWKVLPFEPHKEIAQQLGVIFCTSIVRVGGAGAKAQRHPGGLGAVGAALEVMQDLRG